jgi:hypothetical protein
MSIWIPIPYSPDPAHPEHGLGRHIHRPDGFEARLLETQDPTTIQNVTWLRQCAAFNQGSVGSCTGNAAAGCAMTQSFFVPGRTFGEPTALWIYSKATTYNGGGGTYPPDDTGSSGPASAEALQEMGLISAYTHATDLNGALTGLQSGPGSSGISWYTSFDTPLPTGECPLTPGATVRGGHEIEAFQVDTVNERVWFWQSWGTTWGGLGNGTFWLSYATLNSLFAEGADVTFFTGTQQVWPTGTPDPFGADPDDPNPQPAPVPTPGPAPLPTPGPAPVVSPTACERVKSWFKS